MNTKYNNDTIVFTYFCPIILNTYTHDNICKTHLTSNAYIYIYIGLIQWAQKSPKGKAQ